MKLTRLNQKLMEQIFSSDNPVAQVQALSDLQLSALVSELGLEESGWAVACATKDQVNALIDDLLWKYSDSTQFENFSYDQFYDLLESLYNADHQSFTQNIIKFDEELLIDILSHDLLIFNLDNFILDMNAIESSMSKDLLEKALSSHFQLELDQYLILSRDILHWDIISTLISQLSQENHNLLSRLLERISYITTENVSESDGLYEVLSEREQIIEDHYGLREERRQNKGYVTGPMAKSFFAQLEKDSLEDIIASKEMGIIESQYFKAQGYLHTHKIHKEGLIKATQTSPQELFFLLNLCLENEKRLDSGKSKQEITKEVGLFIKQGQDFLKEQPSLIKAFKVGKKLQKKKKIT